MNSIAAEIATQNAACITLDAVPEDADGLALVGASRSRHPQCVAPEHRKWHLNLASVDFWRKATEHFLLMYC